MPSVFKKICWKPKFRIHAFAGVGTRTKRIIGAAFCGSVGVAVLGTTMLVTVTQLFRCTFNICEN
jgi:hypothetical protein